MQPPYEPGGDRSVSVAGHWQRWSGGASIESKTIDPVGFRKAQHTHWDAAAVGWMKWSEFNDRARRQATSASGSWSSLLSRALRAAAGIGSTSAADALLEGAARA